MSLQYVIDGYNIIKHPLFTKQLNNKIQDSRIALLDFIRINRLCGSRNNKIIVVFDGYKDRGYPGYDGYVEVIFSGDESADERIYRIVSGSPNARNTMVVSDDKEVKFSSRASGALAQGIEEFLKIKQKSRQREEDESSSKLNYSQMDKINSELRKIWLK